MKIRGITIHNTGNELSAKEMYDVLVQEKRMNLCHFIIDEKEVINSYPVEYEASHTGKGYDFGNKYTLAIEIARSRSEEELYLKAQTKAVAFIKKLMKKYKLTTNDIYFHIDFNPQTYCPHRILDIYKTKEDFINGCFL